jgi:hypothetical protein
VRRKALLSWAVDAMCALVAYVIARWTWSGSGLFEKLHFELLTFLAVYLLLQVIVRGRRLARRGKQA